ncbi:MAG: LysR substrate-binding domain-containing protein [Gammaproteobacteria bacterium]|nr:LysR substrate-binding domain-containing protein [Gammaproteobacteria bacterium]
MASIDLNDYYYFVNVVEKGGFTRAAEALGIPKSRISRHIAQLEERLDATLIQRTTRQFKVTELGEVFYQHARAAVDHVALAETGLKRKKNALSGTVTLSCSVGVAQFALQELLTGFMQEHPDVTVHQQVTNQNIDLIAAGVDMSIRGHTGPLPDSTSIQRTLAVVEWGLFTSAGYPPGREPITTPADLANHATLALGWQTPNDHWKLQHTSGAREDLQVKPRFKSDDMATLKQAASAGLGIVALPAYTCRNELASGQLLRVLPQWHAGMANLSLVMPRRSGFTAPVLALKECLQAALPAAVALA